MEDYKGIDDLELSDTVIEEICINHREKSITFKILKPISRIDRQGGFISMATKMV